jgi:hypothetical protein
MTAGAIGGTSMLGNDGTFLAAPASRSLLFLLRFLA